MPESPPIKADKKNVAREVLRRISKKERNWVTSRDFLKSDVWARLSYDAREQNLKLYGNRCMACGCKGGVKGKKLNVDHVKPRKLYPQLALSVDNLQLLCPDCNKGKGNRYETDWRQEPKETRKTRPVYKPTKDVIEKIKELAPDKDLQELLKSYLAWSKGKPSPENPHGAFIGWTRKYIKNQREAD